VPSDRELALATVPLLHPARLGELPEGILTAEYADAGIPFYWLVWLSDDHVLSIDIHVLDHTMGFYRLFRTLTPEQETSTVDVPVRIQIEWNRLAHLIR
jgi:hypothetical protein